MTHTASKDLLKPLKLPRVWGQSLASQSPAISHCRPMKRLLKKTQSQKMLGMKVRKIQHK